MYTKGNQSWIFIGRTDAEAETPVLWPPSVKNIGKDPDAGKDWGQEEKGMIEDEMVGWHHQLDGHGFGWTLATGDGQGSLARYGSWGHKESDTTEQLNWTELKKKLNTINSRGRRVKYLSSYIRKNKQGTFNAIPFLPSGAWTCLQRSCTLHSWILIWESANSRILLQLFGVVL